MKKTYASMEELDLSTAKEVAKIEDWNTKLVDYYNEVSSSLPEGEPFDIEIEGDPWDVARRKDIQEDEKGGSSSFGRLTMESDGYDEDEYTEYFYLNEGEVARNVESGHIKMTDQQLLERLRKQAPKKTTKVPDFTHLGDRKIQVNLSYLPDAATIDRTKNLIENIIKKYTSNSGAVITTPVSNEGIFIFNVTNSYLSPQNSSPPLLDSSTNPSAEASKSSPVEQLPIVKDLITGIKLTPKFPGLPNKVIKYGDHGLTQESILQLIQKHPGISEKELFTLAIKLSESRRTILNLYNSPY